MKSKETIYNHTNLQDKNAFTKMCILFNPLLVITPSTLYTCI